VFARGELVGAQSVGASAFATMRTVATGSWLGRDHQGRGLGRRMREAVLGFAFDHLGAEVVATTSAFLDNARSLGVSRALGYRDDGVGRLAPFGVARDTQRFRMTRADWAGRPRPPLVVEGLHAELFGVR
jgi:RimJ/RimL family protein N-acetyltransferase